MKSEESKPYRIDLSGNNVTILIPQFTVGIAGFNQIEWGDLDINEVIDALYHTIKSIKPDCDCKIYINLFYYSTDKYGKETFNCRVYELMTVTTAEVCKYKNSHYFEHNYDIIKQITRLPFNKKPIREWEKVIN